MTEQSSLARVRILAGFATLFIIGTDLFVVSPLLPTIAARFHVDAAHAGWMMTGFSLMYMLAAPFLGGLSDAWGRRVMIVSGLVLFACANALTAWSGSFAILLASRMFAGLAAAMVSPSIYAITGDVAPPQRRASWLATVGLGLLVALAAGASLGSLLSSWVGYAGVFLLIGGSSAVLALLNSAVWSGAGLPGRGTAAPVNLGMGTITRAVLPTVIWSTAVFGVYTYLGSGLQRSAHFDLLQVSGVVAAYGIGATFGSLFGGRLADRIGARRTATLAVASLTVTFVLVRLSLGNLVAVHVGFVLVGLLSQAFFPAQQARLAGSFPAQRGAIMAWNNSALYFGIFVGSLVGGVVLMHAGFPALLLGCAALGALGAVVNAGLNATPEPAAAPAPAPAGGR
jgi:predicted MFS family arabinose efflux permease